MRWQPLGLIAAPGLFADGWRNSHCMLPTPVAEADGRLRIYCTFCDAGGLGRLGYVDVDADNPLKVVAVSPEPLLELGRPGTFDENGVAACAVVAVDDRVRYLYYVGFELGTRIRYRLLTGLAVSDDGGASFRRLRETPILERSPAELFFRCGPCVRFEKGRFRMWYIAGGEWTDIDGKAMPIYDMRYLESADGIEWPQAGQPSLALTDADEHGFGRPWVVHDADGYRLFYSIRRRSLGAYELGFAISADGLHWRRRDGELGLPRSGQGWDGKARSYAAVIAGAGGELCFYNGDDFGRAGFAVARRLE